MSFIKGLFKPDRTKAQEAQSKSEVVAVTGEFSEWFASKEFSADWTSGHFPSWKVLLASMKDHSARILEIGSYEGFSALFFLNFLPRSFIVCIDPWDTKYMVSDIAKLVPGVVDEYPRAEGRFDRNLLPFADRLMKIKAASANALAELGIGGQRFDMIYVDGSHRRLDAYRDCTLSWPLLNSDGIMLIDDYEFGRRLPDDLKPKQGVDAFLTNIAGQYVELHRGYQIAVRKY